MATIIKHISDRCHPRSKDLCHGYVRNITSIARLQCSMMIYWLITAFYIPGDYLAECGQDMTINQMGDTVTKLEHYPEKQNITMCSQWIHSGAVSAAHWTFQLLSPIKNLTDCWIQINFRIFESHTKDTNFTDLDMFIKSTKPYRKPVTNLSRWSVFIFNPVHVWRDVYAWLGVAR